MKKIYFILIFGIALVMSSCYKEESWVDKNVKEGGDHFPYIQLLDVIAQEDGIINEGDVVSLRLQYWSIDPVNSLNIYETVNGGSEALASSTPYTYSYDAESAAEVMFLNYTVPSGTTGTSIDLRVEVLCDNQLTREKSVSITVE